MKRYLTFLVVVLVFINTHAQSDFIPEKEYPKALQEIAGLADWGMDLVTFEKENYTFFFLPLMGYEERTGFEFGIMPVWRFYIGNKKEGEGYYRPSSISPSFIVSTNGMYEFDLSSDFYTPNNWYVKNRWVFRSLPDKFYGIGNGDDNAFYSNFEVRKFEFSGKVMKGVSDELFVGVNYDFGFYEIDNIEGDVLNSEIRGYDGGDFVGIGPVITYDGRSSITYPLTGNFVELSYAKYFEPLGDFNFSDFVVDARKYFYLGKNDQVLALQSYFHSASGDVPFYRLSVLGGKRLFRGISHPYKYMDKNSAYVQAAYRSDLWWRLGYETFVGVGNVFESWNDSALKNVHLMAGVGLRFRVLENEKLNFRMDFGMTNRGDHGIFFTLGEAF